MMALSVRVSARRGSRLARSEFAADSPLAGDGFEPSVPRKKQPLLAAPLVPVIRLPQQKTGSFVPGTDGSNPSPSSGESRANLNFLEATTNLASCRVESI